MLIAVDGPIGSGKGAVARALARHFRLPYLKTGLHYRAVAQQVVFNGGNVNDEDDALAACDFPLELLGEPQLRSELVADLASRIAVFPAVRQAMFARQWIFAHRKGGAVLEGRDIGTVIAPDADAKLFVTATADARIRYRFSDLLEVEYPIELKELAAELTARDRRDESREQAPLRPAGDAILLDTSFLRRGELGAEAIRLTCQMI
jgi:cytidylate kinase